MRNLFLVCFASSMSFAAPVLLLRSPQLSAVGDTLGVAVNVQSQYVLTSVSASVGSVSAPLTGGGTEYSGTLNLQSLPEGAVTLTITATDALGQTATLQKPLVRSNSPVLVVAAPLEGSVARPMIDLRATCSAALGCVGIEVRNGAFPRPLLTSASGAAMNQSFSLAASEGKTVQLVFVALDANGPMDERLVTVHVDSSPKLVEVVSVGGPILDVDATRVLFSTDAGLRMLTLSSGLDEVLSSAQPSKAFLTSVGAIWPGGEWANGVALATPSTGDLRARNGVAAWSDGRAFVRNLAAGTTQVFDAGVFSAIDDIAENGDVLASWMPDPSAYFQEAVVRLRAGAWTPVASGPRFHRGRTDGINVMFQRRSSTGTGPTELVTPSGQLVSLGYFSGSYVPTPEKDYRLAGGWVAFTRSDGSGTVGEVFRRDPAGTVSSVSVWTSTNYVDGLRADGETMVIALNQRHLSVPGRTIPTQISSALGRSVVLSSAWHVIIGRTLFRVVESTDGGLPDAGAVDAGTDDAGAADAGADDGGESPDAGAMTDGGVMDAGSSRPEGVDAGADEPQLPKSCGCGVGEGALLSVLGILLGRRLRRIES